MDISECLDILGEQDAKQILKDMFTTLLLVNSDQNGSFIRLPIPKQKAMEFRAKANESIQSLSETAYQIIAESGFSDPSRWYENIYCKKAQATGSRNIGDMIDCLRRLRATQIAEIVANTNIPETAKILDYGVGSGINLLAVLEKYPAITAHGYDPNDYVSKELKAHTLYKHITSKSEMADSYDLVILSWVLHHADPASHLDILRDIGDRLAEDGKLVFLETLPSDPSETVTIKIMPQLISRILSEAMGLCRDAHIMEQ